ncbi:HU family DNA-binding protein [Streptosporangium sp. NPDC087985]|uniref:HU family DNA-binding protein n=1 Tax=Streptosporangium sp. NPDC087985 TaxID=3366196 RepID=UPI0038308364
MNKRELIEKAAAEAGLSRRQTAAALDAILGTIQTAVAAEEKVAIPGFGSFEIVHKPARTGRNPQTGEPLEIAETWTARFKPSPGFMGLIRQRKKD